MSTKIQVGKKYTFVFKDGNTFYLTGGEVIKVGRRYIHYKINDWQTSKLELSKIVEVVEAGTEREKEWENYIKAVLKWQSDRVEAQKEIEREEMSTMWDRVFKRLKEWEKENPKPQPPLKSIKQVKAPSPHLSASVQSLFNLYQLLFIGFVGNSTLPSFPALLIFA